jgi:methylthioribulose-1-phosphate dehydratase
MSVSTPGRVARQAPQLHAAIADLVPQIDALREVGTQFWQRGWSLGTSSNYSVVVQRQPLQLLVTASGKDKGRLARQDFVRVGEDGRPVGRGQPAASAETLLHLVAARQAEVGAVLHTHSVWATVLSEHFFSQGGLWLAGYEMLKGLAGITTHQTQVWLEIFDNTQDIAGLADQVSRRLADPQRPLRFGYLIRGHGLYTWGRDLDEARRHVEVLEFLLECTARRLAMGTA